MNQQLFHLFRQSTELMIGTYKECLDRVAHELQSETDDALMVYDTVTAHDAIQAGFQIQHARG